MSGYDVESYWSRVASEIMQRGTDNVVAGDDNPFFRYKRDKFLKKFLHTLRISSNTILEVGCGPGGNLIEIARRHTPEKIIGADISPIMLDLARSNLGRHRVSAELHKIDGTLPFADQSIDLSYTVTVLQHNTDGTALQALLQEICRVTRKTVVLIEDTGNSGLHGTGSFVARSVEIYRTIMAACGFELSEVLYLNTRFSYSAYQILSYLLVSKTHLEGEKIGIAARSIMALLLSLTPILDEHFPEKKGLTRMMFRRMEAGRG